MVQITNYHHLSLSVRDITKSAEWYQAVFDFTVVAQIEGTGFRRTRLGASVSGLTLTLTSHDGQSEEPSSECRAGMDHVAFQVSSTSDIQKLKERFEQLGVDHSAIKESATGTTMITLRDPDNIQLEVCAASPDASPSS